MSKRKSKRKSKPKSVRDEPSKVLRKNTARGVYVLSLTVENVRCFGNNPQTIDFTGPDGSPAHWTVILGENGTGKTTLLECIAAFDERALFLPGLEERRGQPAKQLVSTVRSHATIRTKEANKAQLCLKTGTSSGLRKPSTVEPASYWELWIRRDGAMALESVSQGHLPTCHSYGSTRRMATTRLSDTHSSYNPAARLFDDRLTLRNAEEWLLQVDYAASKQSRVQKKKAATRDLVRDLLVEILPDVSAVRFVGPGKDRDLPGVEFKTPDGWLPLSYLGYGYRSAVGWMVDLASRLVEQYPKAEDPLSRSAVVLIDEIDLHLHPRWQRTLMGYLSERFSNTQFIVTAHSPLFVQSATDANLVVLRREKDRVVIDNDVEAVRGWRVDQVLTSDLFGLSSSRPPQIEKPLQERRKILTKSKLSKADRERLADLEKQIGPLPAGESGAEAATFALLQRALKHRQGQRAEPKRDPD